MNARITKKMPAVNGGRKYYPGDVATGDDAKRAVDEGYGDVAKAQPKPKNKAQPKPNNKSA